MVDIRPQDLNPAVTPIDADSPIIIDQGLAGVNRTTSTEMVNAVAPVASQAESEVGTDDVKRMTALKTKQSIASEVGVSVASFSAGQAGLSAVQSVNGKSGNAITLVKADVGLSNVDNTSDANKPISTATQTALNLKADKSVSITGADGIDGGGDLTQSSTLGLSAASKASLLLADTAVQPNITITAGNGLTGGGTLAANRTLALSSASIASLALADSAVQPSVLNDYATLTQLATKFDKPTGTTAQYLRGDGSLATFPAIPQGTITSVGLVAPTGFTVSNSPVTSSGNLTLSYATGYQGFTAAQSTKLAGIEAGAQVNAVASVNSKTGSVVLNASDVGAATAAQGALAATAVQPAGLTKAAVGLGDVDNTSDANKPVSTAQQTALNLKANAATQVIAGSGLTGGGTLAANRTLALSSASIASLAKADTAVQSVNGKSGSAVALVKGDVGLGNVDNTSDLAKPISTLTQTALNAKANSAITVSAGTGLTGGGNLAANRTVALNAASIASLGKADTAIQAPGGSTGQILAKSSNTTNDVGWISSEAATAVSYGPQTLTPAQQGQARANIGTGIVAGFRNKIINGNFDVWQRGTSFTNNEYTADRWAIFAGGGSTMSIVREGWGVGETTHALSVSRTVTGGTVLEVYQRIEDVRTLSGKRVTVTFDTLKRSGGSIPVDVYLTQRFGAGGSPDVVLPDQQVTVTTEVERHRLVFDIPAVGGKTINDGSFLSLAFRFPTSIGNFTATYLTRVSLVEGDATAEDDPFSPRHVQQEIALCLRYYKRYQFRSTWNAHSAGEYFSLDISGQSSHMRLLAPTIASVGSTELINADSFTAPSAVQLSWRSIAPGIVTAGGTLSFDAEL